MTKQLLFVFLLLMTIPVAFAEEIAMSVGQSTYYFLVGENAIIPLTVDNKYEKQIDGTLRYSITQHTTQGNAQISQSNTRSSSFPIDSGEQIISLDLNTAKSPTTLSVELSYHYADGDNFVVILEPFTIEFVSDESQKNNQQNKMNSITQQSPQQNNPISSQSIQQRLDEMTQSPSGSPDLQQRLQNNQIPQDSSALKQQIYEQLEQDNQIHREFENKLATNEQFQELHQDLLEHGYDVTDGNLNPATNSTGDFQVNYQNEQGRWAKIQGSMTNSTINEIQLQTQQEIERMLEQLRTDSVFQQYDEQLIADQFAEQDVEFLYDSDQTTIEVKYQHEDRQTAAIVGEFEDNILANISLKKQNESDFTWISWLYVVVILIIAISYVMYVRLRHKKKNSSPQASIIKQQPFDHVGVAEKLIKEGKENFEEKNYKDAYGKINQALRLFLSYELNLRKEVTNEEILELIQGDPYPVSDVKKCFRIASLVEFAKYTPNHDDFHTIASIADIIVHGNVKS